jgi:hypothetical protein
MWFGIVVAAVLSLSAALVAQQETAAAKPPKKGDRVVAVGCLSGPVLEANEIRAADATDAYPLTVGFRLTGDKKLLKQMREEENGKLIEVTAILKSELPDRDSRPGTQVGKTRIVIGVGTPQGMQQQTSRALPALEVKSYEARVASCGG